MGSFSGTIYSSGTITGNGNSGWVDVLDLYSGGNDDLRVNALTGAFLSLVPSGLATDETLDLDLNVAFDSSGTGDLKVHDFTQVDSNNTRENLIVPGGESVGSFVVNAGTDSFVACVVIPRYWKFTWVLGGTTKSMAFVVYGVLRF